MSVGTSHADTIGEEQLHEALAGAQDVVVDLTNAQVIDARFLGLLLMLRGERGTGLRVNLRRRTRTLPRRF